MVESIFARFPIVQTVIACTQVEMIGASAYILVRHSLHILFFTKRQDRHARIINMGNISLSQFSKKSDAKYDQEKVIIFSLLCTCFISIFN